MPQVISQKSGIEMNKKYFWLKLKRDFFKRHDIQIIESMPNGKDYVLFYLKLLVESVDHEGNLRFSDTIPYNEQMLATITNTNIDIVRSAMKIFVELNMVDVLDSGTIFMAEIQKMTGTETYWAEQKRKQRENEPLEVGHCPQIVQSLSNVSNQEIDKELDKENNNTRISYEKFVDAFHASCNTLPRIAKLTDARKKALKRCVSEYGEEEVLKTFTLVGQSSFLTGKTGTWSANIDWILKPANMVKILEGSYADKNNAPANRPPYNPNPENLKFL